MGMENPAHNLIDFVSDDKNLKCPEFKKCHYKNERKGSECEKKGCVGKCEVVKEKYRKTDRYVFYFLKKLFSLGDIKIAKGAELNWARGLAIMQPHDITENTEMNPDQLRSLLNGLREGEVMVPMRMFCKDCQTFEYTNTKSCFHCHGEQGNLVSSADPAYILWRENTRSDTSERSVSPMSAVTRRLLQETHRRN